VLYELLTGRPPFLASRPVDTVLQVIREEPVPPRRTQPTLPIDIETICLKALQKDPSKRYVNCAALADDLRRYLVGEPIRARPVRNVERVQRWCRRNPKLAAMGFVSVGLLIAVVVILSVSTVTLSRKNSVIAQQNRDLTVAKNVAEEQRTIAVQKRQVAMDQASLALETIQTLIDKVMTQIGDTPNTQSLKKDLLETAIRGAERVTEHNQHSSREATILAARQKLGELYLKLGEVDKAFVEYEFVYQQALERAKTQQGTDASRYNAASASSMMSDMYLTIKRDMAAARKLLEESLAIYQDILDHSKPGYGSLPPYRVLLGMQTASNKLAVNSLRSGDPAKALIEFRRAHELLLQACQVIDDDRQFESMEPTARERELENRPLIKDNLPGIEATAVLAIGGMLHRLHRPDEAEPYYLQSVAIREQEFQDKPNKPMVKFQLARTLGMLGEFLFQTGKMDRVEPLYKRSTELANELAEADEKMVDYRRDQAIGHYRLGQLYLRLQQKEKALEQFQFCRQLRESMVDPKTPNVKRQMEWMLALAHCGQHVEATNLAAKLQEGAKSDNELLLDTARCFSVCAAAVPEHPEKSQQYTQRALEALRAAREAGYNDSFILEVDADLEFLRGNAEFQQLMSAKRSE
jgi:tetratricopeptide (TPR) repeat protein